MEHPVPVNEYNKEQYRSELIYSRTTLYLGWKIELVSFNIIGFCAVGEIKTTINVFFVN